MAVHPKPRVKCSLDLSGGAGHHEAAGRRPLSLDGQAETPAHVPPIAAEGGAETILLAEDEDGIRRLTSSFLQKLGYRVLSAADGIEARQIAQAHQGRIDLLLSDVVMPRLGGRELARDLLEIFPRLRVVLMSGYAGGPTAQEAINESHALFLQKPFSSMQVLAKKIREALDGNDLPAKPIC